jgi:hypothetical protein
MQKLPALLATSVTLVALLGCGQTTGSSPARSTPDLEPPHVSSKEFGEYVLHFNSMRTDRLQPEVASMYNIRRSGNRVLLIVSIIKKSDDPQGVSVAGEVTAAVRNLLGQPKIVQIRQINDEGVYYYVADVGITDKELLYFDVAATPAGETTDLAVRFSRQFFAAN